MPDELADEEAAPLLCAGITTFNALRHSGATAGDLVAVLGVGGLGHLGVQFAAKMGFETVAIARGTDKEELAAQARRPPLHRQHRRRPGRRRCRRSAAPTSILATVTNAEAMTARCRRPAPARPAGDRRRLDGADRQCRRRRSSAGPRRSTATPRAPRSDSEDTLSFSALSGVRPMIETMPLDEAAEAYEKMLSRRRPLPDGAHHRRLTAAAGRQKTGCSR